RLGQPGALALGCRQSLRELLPAPLQLAARLRRLGRLALEISKLALARVTLARGLVRLCARGTRLDPRGRQLLQGRSLLSLRLGQTSVSISQRRVRAILVAARSVEPLQRRGALAPARRQRLGRRVAPAAQQPVREDRFAARRHHHPGAVAERRRPPERLSDATRG